MKLVVENLPESFPADNLQTAFQKFGDCKIVKSEVAARQGSAAWVQFAEEQDAREAIHGLHDSDLGGNKISVHEFLDTPHPPAAAHRPRSRSRSRSPAKETQAVEPVPVATDTSEQGLSPSKPDPTVLKPDDPPQDPIPAPVPEEPKPKAEPAKGETVTEDDGSKFEVESINQKNDGLSSWKCLACNRTLQKKSVKTHIATKTHKQKAAASVASS